ncbi:DUF6386 domain-containing protein [Kosakonia sp. BK9b]
METTFTFVTGTATLAIFDLACLQHRVGDDADWWSIPEDEIAEINLGNALFLNLGEDGEYRVIISDNFDETCASLFLRVPSGRVFIGAGEDTSGGDLEPDGSAAMAGLFLSLPVGCYKVRYSKSQSQISLSFTPGEKASNDIQDLLRI